ncbi:MAG TPA: sulfite oxidase [Beijerinckiaceae bacterium]|nr:sulfite oxidase [Beijerinckiaceae bacterium]
MNAAVTSRDTHRLGQTELRVVPDAALNAWTPVPLLDSPITPVERFFIRNNGETPNLDEADIDGWRLTIDGEVRSPLSLSLEDLRRFETVTLTAVLECAGNSRCHFTPPTDGLPWGDGAVGCARWTGVRLGDLLAAAGLTGRAVYTGFFSPDRETDGSGPALSRGLPIRKAQARETLVAFAMNDRPLSLLHGAPLRIVAPGFPGSAWQKWLQRIWVRDREHDGMKMTGFDYRLPTRPVAPGETPDEAEMAVIEDMPVKSLITIPAEGAELRAGAAAGVSGFAWSGHTPVARVEVSADGGQTWRAAALETAPDTFAWRRFNFRWTPTTPGPAQLIARATDEAGRAQPLEAPWNPKGYCNNQCHRVSVTVAG